MHLRDQSIQEQINLILIKTSLLGIRRRRITKVVAYRSKPKHFQFLYYNKLHTFRPRYGRQGCALLILKAGKPFLLMLKNVVEFGETSKLVAMSLGRRYFLAGLTAALHFFELST